MEFKCRKCGVKISTGHFVPYSDQYCHDCRERIKMGGNSRQRAQDAAAGAVIAAGLIGLGKTKVGGCLIKVVLGFFVLVFLVLGFKLLQMMFRGY